MQTKKTFQIIALLFIVFIISFLLWFKDSGFGPGGMIVTENKNETEYAYLLNFNFTEDDIVSVKYPYTFSPDQSLFELTKNITSEKNIDFIYEDYGDMGILVKQIGDKENGQDQKYWQYFVEGVQPQISVDKYYPEFGTSIDWKFSKSEF
jgi:hypothetical protein